MLFLKNNRFAKKDFSLKDSSFGFALGAFVVLGVFIFSLCAFASWNNPTLAPTGGNVPEPINAGVSPQYKLGQIRIGSTTPTAYPANFFVYNGGASIGTTTAVTNQLIAENPGSVSIYSAYGIIRGVLDPVMNSDAVDRGWAEGRYATGILTHGWTLAGNWSGVAAPTSTIVMLNGNVGINNTSPYHNLVVGGSSGYGVASIGENMTWTANQKTAFGVNDYEAGNISTQSSTLGGLALASFSQNIAAASWPGMGFISYDANDYTAHGAFNFTTFLQNGAGLTAHGNTSKIFTVTNSATEELTILGNGNVGIGMTAPNGDLDVLGSPSVPTLQTYNGNFMVESTGATSIQMGNLTASPWGGWIQVYNYPATSAGVYSLLLNPLGGNVGIGTTTPGAALEVMGGGTTWQLMLDDKQAGGTSWYVGSSDNGWGAGGGKFLISPNNTSANSALTILNSGYVGIGTTSPVSPLYVQSNLSSVWGGMIRNKNANGAGLYVYAGSNNSQQALQVGSAGNANIIYALTSGNVGIGTSTPGAPLTLVAMAGISDMFSISSSSHAKVLRVDKSGNLYITGQITAGSGDVAEEFYTDKVYPAGTVLVMDDNPSYAEASAGKGYKSSRACNKKYDQTVIGVISEDPGLIVGKVDGKYKAPVALVGVIKVRVNSSGGKIHQGDLLTTSAVTGEAMKAAVPKLGTIIGKALEADTGKGWVMALVNLK